MVIIRSLTYINNKIKNSGKTYIAEGLHRYTLRLATVFFLMVAAGIVFLPQQVSAVDLQGQVVNVKPDFSIYVNKGLNCVTVYMINENGEEIPVKSMVASCGRTGHATPSGTFKVQEGYEWRLMVDNTWAQYAVRFNNHILFHSVPYHKANPATLEADQYNLLGSSASLGCVRLSVEDAKWIYDNVKKGTKVVVYSDMTDPGPLGKPEAIKLDENDSRSCWDPTDPDPDNPWK